MLWTNCPSLTVQEGLPVFLSREADEGRVESRRPDGQASEWHTSERTDSGPFQPALQEHGYGFPSACGEEPTNAKKRKDSRAFEDVVSSVHRQPKNQPLTTLICTRMSISKLPHHSHTHSNCLSQDTEKSFFLYNCDSERKLRELVDKKKMRVILDRIDGSQANVCRKVTVYKGRDHLKEFISATGEKPGHANQLITRDWTLSKVRKSKTEHLPWLVQLGLSSLACCFPVVCTHKTPPSLSIKQPLQNWKLSKSALLNGNHNSRLLMWFEIIWWFQKHISTLACRSTAKEKIFVGEKFRTFLYKTFCTEFNFMLSGRPDPLAQSPSRGRSPQSTKENLVWNLVSCFFHLYESYEIKFPTKISSFTVCWKSMLSFTDI